MKKPVLTIILIISAFVFGFSQVPNAFNYQAVVRNSSGEIVANQNVSLKVSILQNSETGSSVYVETHNITTNDFGLANVKIGKGTRVSGVFDSGSWGASTHFVKVEIDPSGGNTFVHLGTSQLVSVPYAFHAQTVEEDLVDDADADPANEIQSLSLSGTQLSLSKNGGTVTLPTSGGGDNWGTQTVETDATLDGEGTSTNPLSVVGDLTDDQTLSISGNDLTISDGNTVTLPSGGESLWTADGNNIYRLSGNVGIGTNLPTSKLTIGGSGSEISFRDAASGAASLIAWRDQGNTLKSALSYYGNDASFSLTNYATGGDIFIDAKDKIELQSNASTKLTVLNNGNVGIGTKTPTDILTIDGGGESPWIRLVNNFWGKTNNDGLQIGMNSMGSYFFNKENSYLFFGTNDEYRLTISNTGNVGIGDPAPTEKLRIKAGDVSVENNHGYKIDGSGAGGVFDMTGTTLRLLNFTGGPIQFYTTPTASNTETITRMFISKNGYIGIGTLVPAAGLHLSGTGFPSSFMFLQSSSGQDAGFRIYEGQAAKWHIFNNSAAGGLQIYNTAAQTAIFAKQSNSYVGLGTTNPTQKLHVVGNAYKTEGGTSWATSSDIRLKNVLGLYSKGLKEIVALQAVKYIYKKDNPRQLNSKTEQVGFVAQEVQKIFPEAVSEGEDGYLDFNIHSINVAMVNAIKELKNENDLLSKKVSDLESRLEQLETMFNVRASNN